MFGTFLTCSPLILAHPWEVGPVAFSILQTRRLGLRGENLRAGVTRSWDLNRGLTQCLLH